MNEYDDLINQDKTESLRTSMFAASRTQPDQEAELVKLSERTGVPVEAIRLKKPEVEMMDRINSFDYEKVIKESPKLSAWLADPKNAALASDDWENLSGLEKTFTSVRDLGGAFAGGIVGDVVGRTVSGASTLLDVAARSIDRPIRQAFGEDVANLFWYEAPTIGGVSIDPMASLRATGQNIKAVGDWLKPPKERQNLATDVAGGVGQISGQIATFLLTGGGSAVATMFAQGADGMAEKIEKDEASQTNKDIAILTGASITAVTEKIGLDKILNRVPPAIRNRTLRFIADKIAAGGIEAGQEFAEGLLQDIARKTLTNRDAELLGGIEREVTAAGISAAIVRTALGVKGYNRAREQEQFVRSLTDQAAGSKLRERMPEKFKAYIDQLTANGPVENVFIPADQFTTYFQSQGLDPAKEASKLGVQNFAEASVAGTDVVIPTSQFVTQLSGTDALQGLWQDIRFQQGEMTLRESQQFRRDEADAEIDDETLARMTGAESVSTTDYAAVKAQIFGELQGRFAADVADKYASQYAAVITTLAQRSGRDPLELAASYDLRVDMPMMDALKDKIGKVDIDLDPLLDRLRAGDVPDMSKAFGPSLSEFIRQRGGLQDMEETERIDDSRASGQGRIVRPNGQSLDAALEAAVDAGYFDGRAIGELSENDLLEALAQDVGGSPVYSSRAQDQALADQVRVLGDLQGFLDTIGADVTTMTNAEIREKFREDAADGVGEVYDQTPDDQPDLIITHNLTAKNLLHAVKVGGIAVPSLAITRAENPLMGFGEITLIGDRNLADPKGKSGIKVFGADIYSPRYPTITYQFKDADARALTKKLQPAMDQVSSDRLDFDELSRRGSEELTRTPGVMAAFLNERGIKFEIVRRTVKPLPAELQPFEDDTRHSFELAEDAEFAKAALAAHENMLRTAIGSEDLAAQEIANLQSMDEKSKSRLVRSYASQVSDYRNAKRQEGQVDSYPTRANMQKAIEENGLTEDFGEYAQELFDSLKPVEKLFQGFTNSGNRRYIPHTLDNVVKILKKELRGGENFNYGVGTLRSKFTPQFRSLKDIKTNKDRLVSSEKFEQVKNEIDQELDAIMATLQPFYKYSDMRSETVMAVMEDAPKMGIVSALKSYSFEDVSPDAISAIGAFMTKLRELPTEYFEAKILREVSPGEFSGAIVPSDVDPKALQALRDNGVTDIRTYEPGNEADRKAQIASFENLFFQRSTDDKRGSIQIGANRKMKISLFEKANLSTFLHETGHFYLEVMGDLAEAPDAPQQIKDDYAAILKWMGVTSRAQIKTPQHEMFARANEAYLREGKSPSPELRGAFQRFRDWLISIYQSAQDLNVTLSDDLRAVFDRMYATDEQIEAAQNEAEFTQMFATAADAGMSEAEFQAYSESVRQTVERGKEQLQAKLMRQLQREKEAEWKSNREKMRAEVESEVDAQPVYVAFKALKDGQTADEIPVKLSRDNLVEVFGEPFLKSLPRGFQRIYSAQGGVDIDTAAEMFGFDSGRSLIDALVNMKPRDALIEQITDDRMRDMFGDIRFDGTIAEEAMQALHNSERENVLKIELRAIRKKAAEVRPFVQAERNRVREEQAAERQTQAEGEQFVADALPSTERQGRTKAGRTFTYRAFDPEPMKRAAAGLIGQKQVRDIRPQGYLIAERNAARMGAKAMKDGDFMTAAEQKQRELFNHYLYKEASRVLDEVETKAKWLREQGSDAKRKALGKAGADYLEQVDEILERYEFKRVPLNKLAKRESLIAWMEQQEAMGNAVVVPEDVINEARRANWKQIPVDELRGVYDAVKNITHLARLKNKLIVRGQQRDFQAMKDELLDAIADSNLKPTDELMQLNPSERTMRQKGAGLWRSFDAAHIKIEQLVEWLDNGDINGPWARNFFDLADAAQTSEYDLHRKVTKALDDVRKAMPKGWQSKLFDKMDFDLPLVTGTGTAAYSKPTRYTMLSIALNMGNEQNMQRLRDGNRLNDVQLAKVRDAMTADDWKFVQGVWDAIENLWPDMAALEVRASGVAPEKVEPMSFEVDGVTYRGGYFPLVYDSRVSAVGERQVEGDKSIESFMASGFGRPSTNKGATKKRQEQVKQPLLLDMNEVIGGHIAKVVKDISHREAVAGLYKILSDQDIKTALIDRLGEAYYREMRDWTKILVNDRTDSMLAAKGAAKIAMLARTNLTIVSMGWKVTTMMAQFAGFGPSADLVKPGYLGRALLQSTQSPQQTWEMISQKSGEMRNRVQTIDRDVRDSMRRIADKRSIVADVQRTAFILTAYADRIVTVPTWLGAYNQAIAEGKGEEAAIRAGDRAVRLSQGGGGAKDLAAVQRNNELMKLMTMFYTPFSALYARLRDVGHQQSVQGIGYLPKAVARLAALVILPAVLGELLAGRGPDDDEDEVWWATRRILLYPVASLPGIRDFSGLMEQKMIALSGDGKMEYQPSFQISPVVNAIAKAYRNLVDRPIDVLAGEREFDDQIVQGMFESSGLLVGLPTAQVSITGGYLYRLMIGEEQPENIGEVMTGLMFRPEKK